MDPRDPLDEEDQEMKQCLDALQAAYDAIVRYRDMRLAQQAEAASRGAVPAVPYPAGPPPAVPAPSSAAPDNAIQDRMEVDPWKRPDKFEREKPCVRVKREEEAPAPSNPVGQAGQGREVVLNCGRLPATPAPKPHSALGPKTPAPFLPSVKEERSAAPSPFGGRTVPADAFLAAVHALGRAAEHPAQTPPATPEPKGPASQPAGPAQQERAAVPDRGRPQTATPAPKPPSAVPPQPRVSPAPATHERSSVFGPHAVRAPNTNDFLAAVHALGRAEDYPTGATPVTPKPTGATPKVTRPAPQEMDAALDRGRPQNATLAANPPTVIPCPAPPAPPTPATAERSSTARGAAGGPGTDDHLAPVYAFFFDGPDDSRPDSPPAVPPKPKGAAALGSPRQGSSARRGLGGRAVGSAWPWPDLPQPPAKWPRLDDATSSPAVSSSVLSSSLASKAGPKPTPLSGGWRGRPAKPAAAPGAPPKLPAVPLAIPTSSRPPLPSPPAQPRAGAGGSSGASSTTPHTSSEATNAADDQIRQVFVPRLTGTLLAGEEPAPGLELTARSCARAIVEAALQVPGNPRARLQMLSTNLNRNDPLRWQVLGGSMTPNQLVQLPARALAPDSVAQQRAEATRTPPISNATVNMSTLCDDDHIEARDVPSNERAQASMVQDDFNESTEASRMDADSSTADDREQSPDLL
eukprot:EG_transcript_5255